MMRESSYIQTEDQTVVISGLEATESQSSGVGGYQ